ncbi:hypothetical protein GFS60_02195 [Rhodococcus sp. WAY2]|nr:hypothetical protein GFS60_02195 [Rhodococcus sp. WAY2]
MVTGGMVITGRVVVVVVGAGWAGIPAAARASGASVVVITGARVTAGWVTGG